MAILRKANILGDLSAEVDQRMLDAAFYESPDYRTIIESADRSIVVGRRGTGKSALFYRLGKYWCNLPRTVLIQIAPDEHEMIGLRSVIKVFDTRFSLIRASARLAWRYGLMMEIGHRLLIDYRTASLGGLGTLSRHVADWRRDSHPLATKLRRVLVQHLTDMVSAERGVAELADKLEINQLDNELKHAIGESKLQFFVLIDRLDEGYEADTLGVGLVDGFVHAAIDVRNALPKTKSFVFLRDNIFRAIARLDPDYSRTIEGQVLRLHWDEYNLLNMIANRLRVAFTMSHEQSMKIWDECTSRDVRGRDGFRKCLRLTLYRPRDLMLLLNNAFYRAAKHERDAIENDDIESSAKDISNSRLADIVKEYDAIFPGLERFCKCFADTSAEMKLGQLHELLQSVLSATTLSPLERQHFTILHGVEDVVRSLYSVGFLGLKDATTGSFVFCHDGKNPDLEFNQASTFLVHPCYWIALNLTDLALDPEDAKEIHDEYDIEVSSETPGIRHKRIGQIMSRLAEIEEGERGAREFEEWCAQTIAILFAAGLRNVELKPNKVSTQRRDIVARNEEGTPSWKRIYTDYKARQVVFEVKNYRDLGGEEYRQMLSYLTKEYGDIGFIVTRAESENVEKGKELDWAREMYFEHQKIIIKLTAKLLCSLLSKARSPQKHDAADNALSGLLDRYRRNYFSLPSNKYRKGV